MMHNGLEKLWMQTIFENICILQFLYSIYFIAHFALLNQCYDQSYQMSLWNNKKKFSDCFGLSFEDANTNDLDLINW